MQCSAYAGGNGWWTLTGVGSDQSGASLDCTSSISLVGKEESRGDDDTDSTSGEHCEFE